MINHSKIILPLFLFLSSCVTPNQPPTQQLNSERIAQKFGSFGIDVLPESGQQTRISNLFSRHDGKKTCRTFAITNFVNPIDPALTDLHALITQKNQPIGAVFKANGWEVQKETIYIGNLDHANGRVYNLMGDIGPQSLAVYVYRLSVKKDAQRLPYATIAEIYHPDYLGQHEVMQIYANGAASFALTPEVQQILTQAT